MPDVDLRAEAFLFDMDGTLIDSIEAAERIWSRWGHRHGLDVEAFLPTIHGSRAVDTIGRLGLPGVDPVAEARMIEREELDDLVGVRQIPGASAFLASIPEDRWTIVTSAPRNLASARLRKAGITIPDGMVAGEDVAAGKPAPDCFLLGARRLGYPIGRCMAFEDAPVGMEAAEAAGARLVVVGSARSDRARHPSLVIEDYAHVSVRIVDDALMLTASQRHAVE